MKRIGGLWPHIRSFDNLLLAYRLARRGKAHRPEVQAFALDLEACLLELQEALDSDAYQPGAYRSFTLYERKPRLICAAPFVDRVVHHALMNRVEPALDRSFIFDSYACRKGKGVHAAVDRYQGWARRYPFVLKLDIRRYFPSIDHRLLNEKLRKRIKDPRTLGLFERIIATAPDLGDVRPLFPGDDLLTSLERPVGLPIGNLTSQFLANLYLDDFDHWVKEELRARAYLRYVDDMLWLGESRDQLHQWRQRIEARLMEERLWAHHDKGGSTQPTWG